MPFFEAGGQIAWSSLGWNTEAPWFMRQLCVRRVNLSCISSLPLVAPEMLQECCGIHLSGWCICCLREGVLQGQSSFLCTVGSGWPACHLAGLRNDGAESRRTLWWSGRSDTALFESPFDGGGPATQRHQVLETCVGQVWGPQEWDVSRTKCINLKAIRDRIDFLNRLFT